MFSGCEASGSHGQVGCLDASLLPPQHSLDLPGVGGRVQGVLYGATRLEAGDPWFLVQRWFRWIPWGLQLAKPSPVKQCCGWCSVLFWF